MKNITIREAAKKEMDRMIEIFHGIKLLKRNHQSLHFYDFASNYFKDGKYFFESKKFVEAFEAFIISWAYLDTGIKLGFFEADKSLRKYFTA